MSVESILERLDYCKSTSQGEWQARCPAHADHSPSLAIKECSDGRILIHCYAGCGANEIITALGLEMSDLFPPALFHPNHSYKSLHKRKKGPDVDDLIVKIGKSCIKEGNRLTESEKQEMKNAYLRLQRAN